MRIRPVLCLLPAFAVGIPAQHVVGPGALPQISSALAIAAPGATIHVLPGTYAPFAVSIGCTIRALTPGTVTINPLGALVDTTIAPPAGQTVHLVGLTFDVSNSLGSTTSTAVAITSGRVTLDQCTMTSPYAAPLRIQDATVHLQGCVVSANAQVTTHPGMHATNARVTAVDSTFRGSPVSFAFLPNVGQPGVDLVGSMFHASDCEIRAGLVPWALALQAAGGQVWVTDSVVSTYGGCAFNALGGAVVVIARCTLGNGLSVCTTPPSGDLLGVSRPAALQNGSTFALTYATVPNGYAAVFASQELDALTIPGLHAQTQWLGGPGIVNLGVVFADPQGHAGASWPIPAGTWLIDQPLWFQGVTGFALPLQLSPVAGGVIR